MSAGKPNPLPFKLSFCDEKDVVDTRGNAYRAQQHTALAAVMTTLPKELVLLIASYVPPDFDTRWAWLTSALAYVPISVLTHHTDRMRPAYANIAERFLFSYSIRRDTPVSTEPTWFEPGATSADVATQLAYQMHREVTIADKRNRPFLTGGGGLMTVTKRFSPKEEWVKRLNAIRAEIVGLCRDHNVTLRRSNRVNESAFFRIIRPLHHPHSDGDELCDIISITVKVLDWRYDDDDSADGGFGLRFPDQFHPHAVLPHEQI